MATLTIRLFGYPQFLLDKWSIQVERRKTIALVAYLAANSIGSCPGCGRDTLSTLLWPDYSQAQAAGYLRQALWDFGSAGGKQWIVKKGQMLSLNAQEDIWVDVCEFENCITAWKTNRVDPIGLLSYLQNTANLVKGDFLSGFTLRDCQEFDDWQTLQKERLLTHYNQVLEALVQSFIRQNAYHIAIQYAQRWQESDPLNESAYRSLMLLYDANDQRNMALRQFEMCQNILREELGVEPESETVALFRQIQSSRSSQDQLADSKQYQEQASDITRWPLPASRPTGMVTFLFTDIQGSTSLWEQHPRAMQTAHKQQEAIIRDTMKSFGGYVYKMIGDAFQIAFSSPTSAVLAAHKAQQELQAAEWGDVGSIKVRMAIHVCMTEERPDDYVGPSLNRVARIMSAGYGGQVLLSQSVYELIRDHTLPEDITFCDLGQWLLKDISRPERIYQLVASGLATNFPPLNTANSRINLPTSQTPFIGRENELNRIENLLQNQECRIISLTGIGGIGKTRLAIQSAMLNRSYQGSAYFIGLASATSLDDLIKKIAEEVHFQFLVTPGKNINLATAKTQLFNFLTDKKFLFIIDNFEQLVGYASFLSEMLACGPDLKLIVTSRERLNIPEEWVIEIEGLTYPDQYERETLSQYDAIQMFIRMAERSGQYLVADDDLDAVVKICKILKGMPLGIEMAAAWTKIISCEEIVNEIQRDLDFLKASWREEIERHQTLRVVFDYSWRLLSSSEQAVLMKLAIIQSGFTREAALDIADASLPVLTTLCDKSFIKRISSNRYEIHPVLHQYANEKISQSPKLLNEVMTRHALYFSEWLYQIYGKLRGSDQLSALADLRNEVHNLRLARQTLLEQHNFQYLELILPALLLFDVINDQRVESLEITQWLKSLETVLEAKGTDTDGEGNYLLYSLTLAALRWRTHHDRFPERNAYYQQASLERVKNIKDCEGKAMVYLMNSLGSGAIPEDEISMCQQAFDIFQKLNDPFGVGLAKLIMADSVNFNEIDDNLSRQSYQAALAIFEGIKNNWGQALCYSGLMYLEYQIGNFEEAYQLGQEAFEFYMKTKNFERLLDIRRVLGELAIRLGLISEAKQYFRCNLAYYLQVGDQTKINDYTQRLARSL